KYDSEESEDEEVERSSKNKKRRRIVIESDDSDEYMPEKDNGSESSSSSNEDSFESPAREVHNVDRSEYHAESSDNMSETSSPKKRRKTTENKSTPSFEIFTNPKVSPKNKKLNTSASMTTPKSGARSSSSKICTPLKLQLPSNEELDDSNESKKDVREFLHEKWTWLKNDAVVDESKNSVENDGFERSTIRVPPDFYKTLTPAMQQWWRLKEKNFDAVLFFKVGKFYELYHMDAVIGVKELGLVYMKGDYAHAGFPEIAFGRYSECLIGKGYKVARVEQTETPQMMEERCKNSNCAKSKRVVEREICQITSKGTRTYTYQDENITSSNNFLLVICEKEVENCKSTSVYGICFIDTSIGKFTLGQFIDDRHGSRLLTLIALYPPVEVIYEKSSVTKETVQLLNHHLSGAQITRSGSDFWLPYKIMRHLQQMEIFALEDESIEYPETFMKFLDPDDINKETPLKQYELAIKAFAGCISYLNRCGIDDSILSMKLFDEYIPVDEIKSEICKSSKDFKKHMILDGLTLENLDIVPLMSSDNAEGTLLGTMDYCSTSFGKRLFRNWLCSPLCNPDQILDRLNAVDDLVQIPDVVESTVSILKKLPDLERHLSKIHTYGFNRSKRHPETRAIFYEIDTYNKKKINDFLSALEGFKQTSEIVSLFKPHAENFKSDLLKQCTSYKEKLGHFPDMSQALKYFDDAFNHEEAKKKGYIIPSEGIDADYDKASKEVTETLKELDAFLVKQKQLLNCKVSYVSVGKNRYMLEVPENKKVPSEFQFQGGRKGFKRYYTKQTTTLLSHLVCAEESRSVALHNSTRRIYSLFDKDYQLWKTAVHCISSLDALTSLVLYYKSSGVPMCKPEFSIPNQEVEPHLEIINGHHPTFLKYFTGDSYIPNSVYIGPKRANSTENMNTGGKLVLVTGPNMGGKSTLMRQAGALVIMAHVGSYVPAEAMRLTPVDRIFTRVGASDRINKGESTFFVEASETSSILSHASPDSFVLIDELGRGTATFDGTAIAYSTLKYLVDKICCRTLFSTHYHSLCDDYSGHPNVGLGHMACMVEKDSDCSVLEKITFLYKFVDGSCPKSYGFNVAMLAGIAKDIVEEGFMKAQQMEMSMRISILLRRLLCAKSPAEILRKLQNYNLFEDKNQ
ncbi:DNA mismatch repair protein Msh6, partial [Trichonephila clavata]